MNTTSTTARRFTIEGVTDQVDTCECCGRQDLKRAVALSDEHGEVVFMGVVCAAAAMRLPADAVRTGAKSAQAAKDAEVAKAKAAKADEEFAAWSRFLRTQTGKEGVFEAVQSLGGITAARALFAQLAQ